MSDSFTEFRDILMECPKCGWVHFAVGEKYVQEWEADWKRLVEEKDDEWLKHYGLSKAKGPPSRDSYLHCFRCGNRDRESFFQTKKDKELNGHTIQPLLLTPAQEEAFKASKTV